MSAPACPACGATGPTAPCHSPDGRPLSYRHPGRDAGPARRAEVRYGHDNSNQGDNNERKQRT